MTSTRRKASVSGKAGAGTVPKCLHVMRPVGHSAEEGDIARIRPVCRVCSVRGCCVSVEYCQCTCEMDVLYQVVILVYNSNTRYSLHAPIFPSPLYCCAHAGSSIPESLMQNSASLSGSIGESTILQIRFSPRPLRNCSRVVLACAIMCPPIWSTLGVSPPTNNLGRCIPGRAEEERQGRRDTTNRAFAHAPP